MIKFLCFLICKFKGWTFDISKLKNDASCVFIGAPHTSNWDFFQAMGLCHVINRKIHYAIKDEMMKFPQSIFFKMSGAIGINRNKTENEKTISITDQLINYFKNDNKFNLMISPEGTRKLRDKWKTGFYFIAKGANVPIVVCYADYRLKEVGVGLSFFPTNFEEDMKKIMNFYKTVTGSDPSLFSVDTSF